MIRQAELSPLPIREELEALVRNYHHLQSEHKRTRPEGATRRRLEDRLLDVRDRFERALNEWVADEELREEWRRYLDYAQPEPAGPPSIQPVVFRGVSDVTGSVVEIRGRGDELQVWVDGSLIERVAEEKAFDATAPSVVFRLNGNEFHETFEASPESLDALAGFLAGVLEPPWDFAQELLADGLIDVHLGLTPRGRRALAGQAESF